MPLDLTVEAIKAAKFRGPTVFGDGHNGMAFKEYVCVDEPRLGCTSRRENRKDRGRTFLTVDGDEVADEAEACRKLALPPDPNSAAERWKRWQEERAKKKDETP